MNDRPWEPLLAIPGSFTRGPRAQIDKFEHDDPNLAWRDSGIPGIVQQLHEWELQLQGELN